MVFSLLVRAALPSFTAYPLSLCVKRDDVISSLVTSPIAHFSNLVSHGTSIIKITLVIKVPIPILPTLTFTPLP